MPIKKIELTDAERKVLRTLARSGAMSPSKVSAETLISSGKTLNENMADVGPVFLRDDPASADGRVVVLTAQACDLLALDAASIGLRNIRMLVHLIPYAIACARRRRTRRKPIVKRPSLTSWWSMPARKSCKRSWRNGPERLSGATRTRQSSRSVTFDKPSQSWS